MALIETDIVLEDVRLFRDRDGHATGMHIAATARAQPVEGSQDEPSFSGESYVRFELFLDNAREVDTLKQGTSVRLTLDVPQSEAE